MAEQTENLLLYIKVAAERHRMDEVNHLIQKIDAYSTGISQYLKTLADEFSYLITVQLIQ